MKCRRSSWCLLTPVLSALLLSGCLGGGQQPVQVATEPEPEVVPLPTNMGGFINEVSQAMADQLVRNTDLTQFSQNPVAITSFVNLEDFDESSRISEILVENLIHELQVRGHKVIDFKMMPYIRVTPKGDFVRSREVDELIKKQNINIVLTGTYVYHNDGLVVNARMMEFASGVVVSSAQGSVPGWYVDAVEKRVARSGSSLGEEPEGVLPESPVNDGGMSNGMGDGMATVPQQPQKGFSGELHKLDELLFSTSDTEV